MKQSFAFTIIILFSVLSVSAQVLFKGYEDLFIPPLHYQIYQINQPIKVDGLLNEASWQSAQWSAYFKDIEGDKKQNPVYKTRFKMLWDESNIYIAAELEEPAIWATLLQRDTIVFHDNDFEVFIDPDGDTQNYFEIEVNAFKTVFDLFLNKPYRNGGYALINWNAENLKLGINIEGTINKANDKDKKWVVEMAIPFRSLSLGNLKQKPAYGTIWRMNFSRVEWDSDVSNNQYKRKTNPANGKLLPEHNWVWSPQGVINMHYPERWGYVQFVLEKTNAASLISFQLPTSENVKKYLWLIYYKEQDFRRANKKFTNGLNELFGSDDLFKSDHLLSSVKIEATTNLFEASIKDSVSNETWQINQDGNVKRTNK